VTAKQFEAKARSLTAKVQKSLFKKMLRLAATGGIDLNDYGNDYEATMVVLWAAMGQERNDWTPWEERNRKTARNLEHF